MRLSTAAPQRGERKRVAGQCRCRGPRHRRRLPQLPTQHNHKGGREGCSARLGSPIRSGCASRIFAISLENQAAKEEGGGLRPAGGGGGVVARGAVAGQAPGSQLAMPVLSQAIQGAHQTCAPVAAAPAAPLRRSPHCCCCCCCCWRRRRRCSCWCPLRRCCCCSRRRRCWRCCQLRSRALAAISCPACWLIHPQPAAAPPTVDVGAAVEQEDHRCQAAQACRQVQQAVAVRPLRQARAPPAEPQRRQ